VGNTEVGKTVRVVVFREGKTVTLKITLGRREEAEAIPAAQPAEADPTEPQDMLGMTLSAITPELAAELELPKGAKGLVVVAVDEATEAFEKGLRRGDLITEAGQQKLERLADLEARVSEARDAGRKSLLLLVRRGGDPRFIALSVGDE
jgi:serine protease Do